MDKCDIIEILNFDIFCKYRLNLLFWKFGGIIVCIRKFFFGFCSIVNNDCDYVLWIRLEGRVFGINKYILLWIVYIFFINFRFLFVDIFDDIENEIFCLFKENECVCFIGDFNSRILILRDYNEFDEIL